MRVLGDQRVGASASASASSSSNYWSQAGATQSTQNTVYENVSSVAEAYLTIRPLLPTEVTPWFALIKTLQLVSTKVPVPKTFKDSISIISS